MKLPTYAALFLVTSFLAACGGSDSPTAPGNGGDTPEPRSIKDDPSFANDIQEIFDRRGCSSSSCHGAAKSAGMDLRKGAARSNLVGVTSTGDPTQTRVIPGDAQNSYIVMKLEGRQTAGSRMPLGGAPLDNVDLTNIKNWINKGAKAN